MSSSSIILTWTIKHCTRKVNWTKSVSIFKFLNQTHHPTINCSRNVYTDESPKVTNWLNYNKKVFPPQKPGEERRPAYVCHAKENIKYSPWKMWYIACFVRGMTVDEAVKQLAFINKKGAPIVAQVILEAQQLAVEKHNVEYKTNLWVAESFVEKGVVIKGIRRGAKRKLGMVEYFHCNYFVRLEEGPPPKHYYFPKKTGPEMLEDYLKEKRERKILYTL